VVRRKPKNWLAISVYFLEIRHNPRAVCFRNQLLCIFRATVKLMIAQTRDVDVHFVEGLNHLLAFVKITKVTGIKQVSREKNKFFRSSVLI